jgi:Ni,Fe-hydrogenase III component G
MPELRNVLVLELPQPHEEPTQLDHDDVQVSWLRFVVQLEQLQTFVQFLDRIVILFDEATPVLVDPDEVALLEEQQVVLDVAQDFF